MTLDDISHVCSILERDAFIVDCSEPAFAIYWGLTPISPCGGHNLSVQPDKMIYPCPFWPVSDISLTDVFDKGDLAFAKSKSFADHDTVPVACASCAFLKSCTGGCASRRLFNGGLEKKDNLCSKDRTIGRAPVMVKDPLYYTHAGFMCLSIFRPK